LGPERDLLRVMVHRPEWRSRIASHLANLAPLREPERGLAAALAGTPESIPVAALLGSVDGEGRMLLSELLEEAWGALDVDALVAGALNRLDSRPLEAELSDLTRRLPLAAEEEKPALTDRVRDLQGRIAKLNPGRWNVIRKGGRVGS
jgi:hypothetical protein